MHLPPRFWSSTETDVADASGRHLTLRIWGWSDESETEARSVAADRLRRLIDRGGPSLGRSKRAEYYPFSPLREELLEVLGDRTDPDGFVTRNAYGATVLTTEVVLIADVDATEEPVDGGGFFRALFGRPKPATEVSPDERRIRAFADTHSSLGVHAYRTAGGFRVFVTGTGFVATDDGSRQLLEELGSDPLYMRLCDVQGTFRARLSPKPWRVGAGRAQERWPRESPDAAARHERWLGDYERRSKGAKVCAPLFRSGPPPSPVEQRVLDFHEQRTVGAANARLA
ncbi:hypothetical protein F8O01_08160 [Pseudoclavibacter chungangensis]|uniref:Uncharacterized protein n=1 Tax=Pseudoclavibacter chungangensis TaxID=587635 RepID=A0A7J5BQ82_9MICO|nr:hypothetical protein [Pseudoclavibacter chungangensis]KAB1653416.1 hypothetical protein F8O01_15185 [Pseudoclavibacter chungangensis]KAB1657220.1 hypothetical protein F8O01_08160 [Pseudoclavibacter chungangensis]NYJ66349.1 hypothetical protein [Pseudoclavibacter chungangensis]